MPHKPQVLGRALLLSSDQQSSILQHAFGTERHRFAYTAFGFDAVNHDALSRLGFNGHPRTPVLGSYLLGNGRRAYNPCLMRFTSPDNLSPFGKGGINAYAYCTGDPVNQRDDSGQNPTHGLLTTLRPEAFLENPLVDYPGWKNYPNLSKGAKKHIKKLPTRIKKAKKFGRQVENRPERHSAPEQSDSWTRFERNKQKIATSFEKLEELRFNDVRERVQRGLPAFEDNVITERFNAEPPYRDPNETLDPPPNYEPPPAYSEEVVAAAQMIRR